MARILVHPMSVLPFRDGLAFSAPYTLGCLVAYCKVHGGGRLNEHFEFGPITPTYHSESDAALDVPGEPGVFLFSSYVWNHEANLRVAREIRARSPGALIVFGGPQVPRNPTLLRDFMGQNPCVDVAVRGEGEETLAEVLDVMAQTPGGADSLQSADLSRVQGLMFRSREIVGTPDRPRAKSLEEFPSPYTTGLFDHWIAQANYVPLETNRGCPYGCTFCDWGAATLQKVRPFSLERVFGEIEYAGRNKITSVFLCDANFGILKRDVEIADRIVETRRRHGYPALVSYSSAKVVRPELKQIVAKFRDAGLNTLGHVALQTTDPTTLANVKRSNIKLSEYDKLIEFFRQENISVSSDMMLGLPGQTFETTKRDMQFLFDRHVHARSYATIVMPNAPMNDLEYRALHKIEIDAAGHVMSTASFGKADLERMFDLCYAFKLLAGLGTGLLKYLLLFLQVDHGVPAVEYVSRWMSTVPRAGDRFPVSFRLWERVLAQRSDSRSKDTLLLAWGEEEGAVLLGDLGGFIAEALQVTNQEFGVDISGSDVKVMAAAQEAVLPSRLHGPRTIELVHDVSSYIGALHALVNVSERPESFKALRDHGPGTLTTTEDRRSLAYNDWAAPYQRLELRSSLFG